MGGRVRIALYARTEADADAAAFAAFDAVADVDAAMSDYKEDSELSRFNRRSGQGDVAVSAPLMEVLQSARRFSALSGGAFDVTVGPAVQLWRRARKEGHLPDAEDLRATLGRVGWNRLRLDPARGTARLDREGMRLDLGAIAKGYACDRALRALQARGVRRALVDAEGDLALGDPPPERASWRVRIAGEPDKTLLLARCGVATSGDAERYVEVGGRRFSHIVDPRTGLGLETRSQVTVVAPDGMSADALATALSVLGAEKGIALAESLQGTEAWMKWKEGERTRTAMTRGLSALVDPAEAGGAERR